MSTQSCPAVCNSMNCSPPGCSVHGIFQSRILEWVAISFSKESSSPRESNPCLFHLLRWQVDSLPLCHLGSPLVIYNFLAGSIHRPFPQRIPQLFGEFSECIWICSGAWWLQLLHCAQSLWSDSPLTASATALRSRTLREDCSPTENPCVMRPQTAEPAVGQQVLGYCYVTHTKLHHEHRFLLNFPAPAPLS